MGFGETSLVFAGHAIIILASIVFFCRMIPMAVAARRAEVGAVALSNFPICVTLFGVISFVEAVYYGLARLLIEHGVDLWEITVAVGLMRVGVAVSMLWHLPSYLKWRGYDAVSIRRWVCLEAGILVAIWWLFVLVLW